MLTNTSPWQARGEHQHPSIFPLSSGNCCIREGCVSIQDLNLSTASSLRCTLYLAIVPALWENGLPHLDGRPMYTSKGLTLQ